ncbi:DUF5677 domain-containing protein [Listeria monocytogenes]|uniref:DUF5677 domain-containing protein n=1 Tax=Listeria monocytogenes TaxID=1639 RepID=UPI000F10A0D2|nr:DUF5677 domain-containing protein [Listeria monocytogenes]EAC5507218.1 hypothetical protein [Listeria monocytogenes]EAC7102425.1 hypothetical protein [Listeria monocytogenes]EAC7896349.1 hypothetical protein [Listeria monocytogenes]EAD0699964.1 hypothetical protein [Listeria monocytogenes]EAD1461562.1 hypothetical protein [Listeria monocytogenes]
MNTLYYRVSKNTNFETAAREIFDLLVETQQQSENQPRFLHVEIDGHLNELNEFDNDMLKLQQEFGEMFLLQFFTSIRFPLLTKKNPKKQINDIPKDLTIYDLKYKNPAHKLQIENYYNTEFVLEKDVYVFLEKVSNLLKKYEKIDNYKNNIENEEYDKFGLLVHWQSYMKDLIVELFNSFVNGNLISNAAMTRSLIECYVYISIIKKERNPLLVQDWFLCNLINGSKRYDDGTREILINTLKELYDGNEDMQSRFKKGNTNNWLSTVIAKKNITFRDACEYLEEDYLYKDFQEASSFVHAQDIQTKLSPFFSYSSIYGKLYIMIIYMFKALLLFESSSVLKEEIAGLELELLILGENFL